MTLVAADAAELDWVDAAVDQAGPDADVGFWSMSPASAEQVTVQIRKVLDRAWEFIALAYKGRAFIALGYPNWDAYVDARFGDLRIAVPREHRAQVVAELAGVRMSCRAIAKVLGVGVATVHRELARSSPGELSGISDDNTHAGVIGRDGKEYPRTRRTELPAAPCSTCGEHHPEQADGCPWDLFAQGLAPHPHSGPTPEASAGEETTYGIREQPEPQPTGPNRQSVGTPCVTDAEPTGDVSRPTVLETLTGLVGQLEAVLEEVSGLGDVVRAIEDASADLSADHRDFGIEGRVRRSRDDLERQATGWPSVAVRLGLASGRRTPVELMTGDESAAADRVSDGLIVRGRPPFAMTPTSLLRNPSVSSHAVRLWSVLASYTYGDRATDRPSQAQLAADVGWKSPRSVDGYLTELQDAGYLTVQRR